MSRTCLYLLYKSVGVKTFVIYWNSLLFEGFKFQACG